MRQLMKEYLGRTLLEMCEDTPLASITVTNLTERANISRRTFYNHFSDINDCINYTASLPLLSGKNPVASVDNFVEFLYEARDHACFYQQVMQMTGQNNFRQTYTEWIRRNYRELFVDQDLDEDERVYRQSLVDIFVVGATDFMFQWFADGLKMEPEEALRIVFDAAPDFVRVRVGRTPNTLPDYPR